MDGDRETPTAMSPGLTLTEAGNIGRWAVTLSPFVRLDDTQGSMAPCDLIFEHTAFCRRLNMQGG